MLRIKLLLFSKYSLSITNDPYSKDIGVDEYIGGASCRTHLLFVIVMACFSCINKMLQNGETNVGNIKKCNDQYFYFIISILTI